MPSIIPNPLYPDSFDTDRTLFLVSNSVETIITKNNAAWAEKICIKPVLPTEEEQWAENGFATINGELLYYNSVEYNEYGKIIALKECLRNIGGDNTKFNPVGTDIRSFVIAEYHNQLVSSIINLQTFVGISPCDNNDNIVCCLEELEGIPTCSDDNSCPDITFDYTIVTTDSEEILCSGTTINYTIDLNGNFDSFRLDFGDGTFTTLPNSGTKTYPPGTTIDPVVRVSNDSCEIILTGIERTEDDEPSIGETQENLLIPIPAFDIPEVVIPTFEIPEFDLQLPTIQTPCLDNLSGVGSISLDDIIISAFIPSIIDIIPPVFPPTIDIIPPTFPSTIDITPPTFPSTISITPPSFPASIDVIDTIPTNINVIDTIPTNIAVTDDIPDLITVVDTIPDTITITGSPIPSQITVTGDGIPSNISLICCEIPATIAVECCDIPSVITFDNCPTLTVDWGNVPTLVVSVPSTFGEVPTATPIPVPFAMPLAFTTAELPEIKTAQVNSLALEQDAKISTFALQSPMLPSVIKVDGVQDIPNRIEVIMPEKMPKIEIDALGIPEKIDINWGDVPEIEIKGIQVPSIIQIEHDIPSVIRVEGFPEYIPLRLDPQQDLTFKVEPGEVKLNFNVDNLFNSGDDSDGPCFKLVPCKV